MKAKNSCGLGIEIDFFQGIDKRVTLLMSFLILGPMLVPPCAGGTGVFENTGSFAYWHYEHSGTLLPNGNVLVTGGGGEDLYPSEEYDVASGTWTSAGILGTSERNVHTATLLPSGKVLVAGGIAANPRYSFALYSADLYDPVLGAWTATGSLLIARGSHTATLLPNGKVLVAGGDGDGNGDPGIAELYDPTTGIWTATGRLGVARAHHTMTLLPNGKVLVAGGSDDTDGHRLASAELYDPMTGNWMATGDLVDAQTFHTATLLADGKVLVTGRFIPSTGLGGADLYDPSSGTWTSTGSLGTARYNHTATLLPDGNVLVAGGTNGSAMPLSSAELYIGPPASTTLLNISTRMRVLIEDKVLIGGFIITGTELKRVLIRGIGPSLNGVEVTLPDPILELHQGATIIATNDNWKTRADGSSQQADIEATTIPPTNDAESAILAMLSPGAYTAVLSGKDGGTGVGLVEVYDLGQGANSQPANISTRGFVEMGDNVMIGGFIVGGGGGGGAARVLLRALGPSVPVAESLGDPTLELYDGSGTLVAANDNWKTRPDGSSQQAEIEATGIPPTNDLESALVRTLEPGNYTAIVEGKGGSGGVALVEAYHLP